MSTVMSDADRDSLSNKVAQLVEHQQAADAADVNNDAAQAALAKAQSDASGAAAALEKANTAVLQDEKDLEAFVEGLLAAQQPAPAPAPTEG